MRKTVIRNFILAFIEVWDNALDEELEGLSKSYVIFTDTFKLPQLSADELLHKLDGGEIEIIEL